VFTSPLQGYTLISKTLMLRERVLFIGTQFSILYTSMYSPAGAASHPMICVLDEEARNLRFLPIHEKVYFMDKNELVC
jgi:hypothetical protein